MKRSLYILLLSTIFSLYGNCQIDASGSAFYKVYTKIFSVSCAVGACHDGTFEPDLRTLESSYYTLVYHPLLKNNEKKEYIYRVLPGSPDASVLYQRISNCCFVNVNDRMPFTIGDTLSRDKIDLIKNWIQDGAKDICGNTPKITIAPVFIENNFNSYTSDTLCISADGTRIDHQSYNPFIIKTEYNSVKMVYSLNTQDTARIRLISNPVVKITDSLDDYTHARIIKLSLHENRLEAELNPADFKKGKIYFMQVELTDDKAKYRVSYPQLHTEYFKKRNWSFSIAD